MARRTELSQHRGTTAHEGDTERAQWEARLQSLQQKIKAKIEGRNGASKELRTLERAGVPREALFLLLALTVSGREGKGEFLRLLRERKNDLLALAANLEKLYPELERALRDPLMRREFWLHTLTFNGILGAPLPKHWTWSEAIPGASFLPPGMRVMPRMFRNEANYFVYLLRTYGRRDSAQSIGFLLFRIFLYRLQQEVPDSAQPPAKRPFKGRFQLDYLPEIAWLLTYAFEAGGMSEEFTPEGLQKVWDRIGLPMLARWYKNAGKLTSSAPTSPALRPNPAVAPVESDTSSR